MENGKPLPVLEVYNGIKIRYSDWYQQVLVLYPEKRKPNNEVLHSLNRFESVDDAKKFIDTRLGAEPVMWWEKY